MNERIKELLARAGFNTNQNSDVITNNHFGGYMDGRQFEKFAELIVKECTNNLEFHGFDDAVPYIKWMAKNRLGVDA